MTEVTQSFASKTARYLSQLTGQPVDPSVAYSILQRWQPHEGGTAAFNPLNTTQGTEGGVAGNYNSVGVKEFSSEDAGAKNTAATIANGYYPDVLKWFVTGTLSNPTAAAQQISKWGTTGFANEIAQGGGLTTSTSVSPPSTASTTSGFNNTDADFQQFLDSYLGPKPKLGDFTDQPGYPASAQLQQALTEYSKQAGSLSTAWANVRGPQAKGVLSDDQKAQQAIANKMAELDLQVRAGQIDAQAAASNLSAFVNQQTNAINLTKDVANAKDQEIKYGLGPSGKTDFSYADMGGGASALAKAMGIDPGASNISYTGSTTLDPEGDYARIAGGMGVGGLAPTVNPHMMATVSQGLDEWGRPTSGAGTDTGSAVGTGFGGIGSAVSGAGSGFINPTGNATLPPGYGSTAGLGDATTPQNAITPTPPTTPTRWGILGGVPILPPAKVGVR